MDKKKLITLLLALTMILSLAVGASAAETTEAKVPVTLTVVNTVALTELGISLDDERFVKNGQTLPQVLERFACEDGSYRHSLNGNSDEMATEQAFYALAAIHRAETGKTTLYDMTDVMQ